MNNLLGVVFFDSFGPVRGKECGCKMKFNRENQSVRDQYINSLFGVEDELLISIRAKLREDGKEGINVGPYEGKTLNLLAKLIQANKAVEIGTLYGYSSIWISRALPKEGKLYCLESEVGHYNIAKDFFSKSPEASKIEILLGDANINLKKLEPMGPFDLVFIDANKSGYMNYLLWAETNVRPGGLIIGDNTFLFGHVLEAADCVSPNQRANAHQIQVMRDFNQRLANPSKYNSILLPTNEGLTVAQKLF